ncbi:MAG: DUF58 domain-containing protein [Propionibacteriaceae bacterium]|nr:DUF58 domain-containing protein [Propionibacteriaceae bacterium]
MTQVLPEFAPPSDNDGGAVSTLLEAPKQQTIALRKLAPEAAMRRLELTIVRRLEGFLQGDHLGLVPGPGTEPGDARVYVPGQDDVRRMDWAVTARTTVPHVRDSVADRELEVWALLDVTPSMNWGTAGVTKRDLGIAAIATIGFISQKVGDRFGGMILRPDSIKRLPALAGRNALYGLLGKMLEEPIVPDHAPGDLALSDGIEQMNRTQRRRGLRVVVSDFLTPGDEVVDPTVPTEWERQLRRLTVRNQVLCVEVIDAAEMEFPDVGELLIKDPETNFERYVNTSDAKARALVDKASAQQRARIAAAMRRAGVGHIQLRTDRDWVQDIARFVLNYRRTATVLHVPPQGVAK